VAAITTVLLVVVHNLQISHEYETARDYFVRSTTADARREARKVEATFNSIYENIRTIALLPGVINIDRYGSNIGADGRETIQQIFNNLAHGVSISQIYIVPVAFDPKRRDPVTGRPEEPALMFGRPISKKQQTETVTIFEYRRLRDHQTWLQSNFPTADTISGLNVPMISGAEVVTRDNTHFAISGDDADRSGLVFSVPFYGADGALKGSVSATILSNVIRGLLPPKNYTLLNVKYGYFSRTEEDRDKTHSRQWVERGVANPDLVASSVIDVAGHDPRSEWRLWVGLPNTAFYASSAANTISLFEFGGYVGIALLMMLLLFMQWLETARANVKRATEVADKTREAHSATLEAERETRRLNVELEASMVILSETQKELVRHERLATLGQVTATLSHEIRNPLGAIRSSLYVIRQAVNKAELKLDRPLDRIERSVSRCDSLIDDFLEYTRTNELCIETVDASEFLSVLLDEQTLPDGIHLIRSLPVPGQQISVDPDRFRRVIINLVENAAQAIQEKNSKNGEISMSCRAHEGGSVINVRDNGPGIPDDVIDKIFEPLFTTKSFGAGLGLPTVKQLVEQHDGELKIDTEPGVGTTFSVFLPRARAVQALNDDPSNMEKAA